MYSPARFAIRPWVRALGAVVAFAWITPAPAAPGDTQRISAGETPPALSTDGRYVAFRWDGNPDPQRYFSMWHIYLADRTTDRVRRVSDDATVWEPDDDDYVGQNAAISADGRYVAYMSQRYGEDWSMQHEVLVRDRREGVLEHIAAFEQRFDNWQSPSSFQVSISGDGRFVAFDTNRGSLVPGDTNGAMDVFVHDRMTKALTRASIASSGIEGNGHSRSPTLSPNGRYVAYWSSASNLVPNDTNGVPDVFLRDRQTGITERLSVNSAGEQIRGWKGIDFNVHFNRPAVSSGARYVAFVAATGDKTKDGVVFLRDRLARTMERIDSGTAGAIWSDGGGVSLSADGRYVAFVSRSTLVRGDRNAAGDIFVRDGVTGEVEIASVLQNGLQLSHGEQPSLSGDGRAVAFFSYDRKLGRRNEAIYVHELGGTRIWGYRMVGGADLGSVMVGTISDPRFYTVENTGSVALPIVGIELRGPDATQFVLGPRCGPSLAAGARCNVAVSFAPTTVGLKTVRLAVTFNLREGTGSAIKTLAGQGVAAMPAD